MKIGDVMTRGVEFVSPDETVREAATRMAEHDVGALPVGSEERIEGILTDRDIILRVVVDGRDPNGTRVRDVMSSTLFLAHEGDSVDAALQNMREHQIRRLPVLDEAGHVVGIVTLGDLARAEPTPDRERAAEALRDIAEPHRQAATPPEGRGQSVPS